MQLETLFSLVRSYAVVFKEATVLFHAAANRSWGHIMPIIAHFTAPSSTASKHSNCALYRATLLSFVSHVPLVKSIQMALFFAKALCAVLHLLHFLHSVHLVGESRRV